MAESSGKIEIENVNRPGRVERVAKDKYEAMKTAYLAVIPQAEPGATTAELKERLLAKLPDTLFPGGAKAGWWMKAVQLDLEAKGVVAREDTKPLRFYQI